MAAKKNKSTPVINAAASEERLRARLELRRSSAASRHVPAARKGSRAANRRKAIAAAW